MTACFDDFVACTGHSVVQSICPEEECQYLTTFPGTGFNSQLVSRDSVELAYSMSGRGPIEGPCLSEGSELSDLP